MKSLSDIKIYKAHRYERDEILLQSIRLPEHKLPIKSSPEIYTLHHQASENCIIRGKHAHRKKEEILTVLQGQCHLQLHDGLNSKIFHLKSNGDFIFIPKMIWHEIIFQDSCILQVISSTLYQDDERLHDFIEDFAGFLKEKNA
jgi:dTDP-4-dehydrorhamnose 3,5-epimerase-like enzyme